MYTDLNEIYLLNVKSTWLGDISPNNLNTLRSISLILMGL
jgi:hypothetical protein